MSDFDDILGADIDTRSEKAIQNEALVRLSALDDSLFWRQNTGQAWQGERLKLRPGQTFTFETGMVVLRGARPVKFGLEGSGDIMGARRGTPIATEIKDATGSQRIAQANFEKAWTKAGGVYILARSPAEAEQKVKFATD